MQLSPMDELWRSKDERMLVVQGDITSLRVDALVNAANSGLLGGGGVDGAIHAAGGPAILEACRLLRSGPLPDGLPAGQAVETTAGELPARLVIHTVGPVWAGGKKGEAEILASAYRSSLELARRLDCADIAFPAISTGVYGYPAELADRLALKTVGDWLSAHESPRRVFFVLHGTSRARAFLEANGLS